MSRFFDIVPSIFMQACREMEARTENGGTWVGGQIPDCFHVIRQAIGLRPDVGNWLMVAEGLAREWAVAQVTKPILAESMEALRAIASLGGNLPDDSFTHKSGPNDSVQRGLMYVESRRLANEVLEKM